MPHPWTLCWRYSPVSYVQPTIMSKRPSLPSNPSESCKRKTFETSCAELSGTGRVSRTSYCTGAFVSGSSPARIKKCGGIFTRSHRKVPSGMWLVGFSKETKIFVGMLARGLGLLLQLKPWEIKRWIHGPTVDAVRSHLNVNVIFHAAAVVFRYVLSGSYGAFQPQFGHLPQGGPIQRSINPRQSRRRPESIPR